MQLGDIPLRLTPPRATFVPAGHDARRSATAVPPLVA